MKNGVFERKSNIELLRIISMLMIVAYHFYVHGNFDYTYVSVNKILIEIFSLGGRIGYDCFIIITGYFLVKSQFKVQKIIKIVSQVVFYSMVLFTIFVVAGINKFTFSGLIKSMFPITYMSYSFATEYIIILLISDYINKFINSIDKKGLLKLIIILFSVWSIIPTILKGKMAYSSLGLFILLYLIGAYIRLYEEEWMNNTKLNVLILGLLVLLLISSVIVINILGIKVPGLLTKSRYFSSAEKIPIILISIIVFIIFKNLDVRYNKFINLIGKSTFAVLLIHDNNYVRQFLWISLFKNAEYQDSKYLILYAMITVLVVFSVCIIIDIFKRTYIDRLFWSLLTKYSISAKKVFINSYIYKILETCNIKIKNISNTL